MTEAVDSHPPPAAGSATSSVAAAPSRLLSDERLARRAAKGDQRAFAEIYRRYHQSLFGFCMAMIGNHQDAQDTLQNTMIKVLRALPGEEREIKLKPWLYRIARNEAIETVRRRRDSADIDAAQTASSEKIAETVEARDRLRRLIDDLDELPERQKAALVMRELAGLDFAQIGAAFESSAAVARQTVYEARMSLRQMEEGREMTCESVMQELSDADGRVIRRRAVRAHLRNCPNCRAFRDSIEERPANLAAIAPLPLAASMGILQGVLGGSASAAAGAGAAGGAGGLAGSTVAAGAGKAIAASAIAKSAATVAVVAAVGVTAADRGGVIDVPLPGGSDSTAVESGQGSTPEAGSAGAASDGAGRTAGDERDGHGGARDGGGTANGRGRGLEKSSGRGAAARGGAHGRARKQAKSRGRTGPLPEASSHGQSTAAGRKSPKANPSPGVPPARGQSAPAASAPASKPAAPKEKKAAEAAPVVPEAKSAPPPAEEARAKGKNGVGGGSTEP